MYKVSQVYSYRHADSILSTRYRLFFRDPDLSKVKEYCYRQWTRILQGRISIQDFTFAKEVRLGTYRQVFGNLARSFGLVLLKTNFRLSFFFNSEKSRPPHVIVAAMRADQDAADEPQYGERVPYIIVQGEPGDPQYMRARRPEDALEQEFVSIHFISRLDIVPTCVFFFKGDFASMESTTSKRC